MYNDYYYTGAEDGIFALFAILGGLILFISIFAIAVYIVGGLGLKKLADRNYVDNSWLAFIPIANLYILGKVAEDRVNINNLPMWLVGGSIASAFSGVIPIIGFLIPLAFYIFTIYVIHKVFEKYSDKALIMTIVGIFTGLQYVFLFFIRNNDER